MTATLPLLPETGAPLERGRELLAPAVTEAPSWRASAQRLRWLTLASDVWLAVALVVVVDPLAGQPQAWRLLPPALAWVLLLACGGRYRPASVRSAGLTVVGRAALGAAFAALLAQATTSTTIDPGRLLLAVAAVSAGSAVVGGLTAAVASRAAQGTMRVLVVGPRERILESLPDLEQRRSPLSVVAACVTDDEARDGETELLPGVEAIWGLDQVRAGVERHRPDAVVAVPGLGPAEVRRLGWQLEPTAVELLVTTGLPEVGPARASLRHAGPLVMVSMRHAELRGARRVVKAVVERLLAAVALVVLAPLLGLLVVLVRLESNGPALFRQTRVGRDGVPFTMLKLRTMCADAEDRRALLASATPEGQVLFKMRHDPRVTRVGRFLRTYSLDELPQLVNVVRGEMALVGPRPPLPAEVEQYDRDTHRRLAVTPGLTGLWQVSGRSDLTWEESVRLDLRYVDDWSIGMDLRILLLTVAAVVGHRGAY